MPVRKLSAVKRLLQIQRYTGFVADFWATHVLAWWLKGAVLSVGRDSRFFGAPIISLAANSAITIGGRCRLVSRSRNTALGVNHPMVLRTVRPGARLALGDGVRASGTTICAAESVQIGARCVIGANATIVDTDFHSLDPAIRSSKDDAAAARTSPVLIGDDVFIGGGSYILKGVRVGNGAVIGAASVVTKDVPSLAIVGGNPARVVGEVTPMSPVG
jgi:acetyltransferase-like isoleucine patch superfamily enzyme